MLLPQKRLKKVQPALEPRVSIIPFIIPRHIKTRVTKANPKIGDKEWAVSFIGNKEDQASSSSDNESIDNTSIFPLRKHVSSTQPCPPSSPIHLERIRRVAPREPLINAQRFPLSFINGNPTPITPYSKFIYVELVEMETINVQAPTWTKYNIRIIHVRPLRLYQQMP